LTGLCLALSLSTLAAREPVGLLSGSPDNAVLVTIIYDNYQHDASLETDWGFACLVEYKGEKLLFDAGRKSDLFIKNMKLLGIHPMEIRSLFISHEHGDHTAGMPWVKEVNPSVICYLPSSYAAALKANNKLPDKSVGIKDPEHLFGPFYSTGDNYESFREQGLVVKTGDEGVLITGCGHPGVIEMVTTAEKDLGIRIHTVIGGLHLLQTPSEKVVKIATVLQDMGIRQICPTHCTGDQSIAILKESFGKGYIAGGTGKEIVIQ
jgi:7,8-dihydropterin-6-yl-methyl-4-(beta-D-ribofuranosyl)aminobenzene 5'-phosphate synthase